MAFRGWPVEALEFYEGLEADNSKTYWQRHREVYERAVRIPMEQLLAELEPEFGPVHIFRPYRDVRFSRDKSPYKTAIGGTVGAGYVQLNARGLAAGCGMYDLASDQLERFRAAIDDGDSGAELEGLVAAVRTKGITLTAHGSLKTAPRGYAKDHPRIELLRSKGLVTWREWEAGAWLGTARAKDRVVGFLRDSAPIAAWLDANVGPTTLPNPRR
jgi:uncharacterized protein (TIGR02453 family)